MANENVTVRASLLDNIESEDRNIQGMKYKLSTWVSFKVNTLDSLLIAVFEITFRSRTRTAKSNEQLENGCLLVKFWKPFVNLFPPSDGQGNFGAFSTCSRCKNHFPYRTRKIPNSANFCTIVAMLGVTSCINGLLVSVDGREDRRHRGEYTYEEAISSVGKYVPTL